MRPEVRARHLFHLLDGEMINSVQYIGASHSEDTGTEYLFFRNNLAGQRENMAHKFLALHKAFEGSIPQNPFKR